MNLNVIRYTLFSATIGAYIVTALVAHGMGIGVDYREIAKWLLALAPPLLLGIVYARWRNMDTLASILEVILCGLSITLPVGLSTYLAMGANHPLADELLVKLDQSMGFNWQAFIQFVDQRPFLAWLLENAYCSFSFQLLLLPILLVLLNRQVRAYLMVVNYAAICFVSSFVSIWFPAVGTYTIYGVTYGSLKHINAYFGFAFLKQFHAVRENPDFLFSPVGMMGILTFPSVHAAVATLCAWAVWPIRYLRLPFLVLNVLMATSAISHANHYFVDVLAGLGVAGFVIAVTNLLATRQWQTAPARSTPELATM